MLVEEVPPQGNNCTTTTTTTKVEKSSGVNTIVSPRFSKYS
jgi:hypothetical protein